MDISSIGLISALVGTIVALGKIIEHLILKKKRNGHGVLTIEQSDQLKAISKFCMQFEIKWEYIKADIKTIKEDQIDLQTSILKLVNSQDRVTERLLELISKIDKMISK